ncbi:Ctf8p [Kluyveromyces lactis]|uniref:KLLA0B04334p n=1 Tax=Kluyveromyces lactis (strain ATCC 8585 / CBS 2359 / DSM 70799 / NBRC 1267 / NRRL Y-1140 / WM37) TaxID=284590 RepID=Q6CWG4_KLULA|nr:uncharacterized protein KLLA0_B04334g [Kluyveromyces lactis]CAH02118.1 KLLA0B04334p [Kluyveromyces lactis]|eukprot:XP_451725.1 uncharacterized protein KLLA0_B04334g [Kluyveromyces lactis]
MPSVDISVNQLIDIFAEDRDTPPTVSTSLGHVMIEIQGDLQHPQKSIDPALDVDSRFIEHEGNGLVRFGILSYDLETKHVTLFIGNKQRLMGSIVKIEPPLGLLKFDKADGTVSLRDVLKYKIIFKNRPLPIM